MDHASVQWVEMLFGNRKRSALGVVENSLRWRFEESRKDDPWRVKGRIEPEPGIRSRRITRFPSRICRRA